MARALAVHRVLPALFVLLIMATVAPASLAQSSGSCDVATPPDDGLESAALGLTRQELDSLYSPVIAAQTGWIYEFDGFDLTLTNCDLILTIDPGGQFTDPEDATDLVRTLLPEDAVLAGSWQFGTLQSAPQDADEWLSGQLAARYRQLGEPLSGSVLVLYSYDGNAYNPGSITRVELRPAVIPES